MIKNTLYSSGQTVTLADGQTYTLKTDEVFINGHIFKKQDCEIALSNNSETQEPDKVLVGIQLRGNRKEHPAYHCSFNEWLINNEQPESLSDLVEKITDNLRFFTGVVIVDDISEISNTDTLYYFDGDDDNMAGIYYVDENGDAKIVNPQSDASLSWALDRNNPAFIKNRNFTNVITRTNN